MLHEGLGSVDLWGDFPDKIAAATGAGVFVYSRAGYGKSTGAKLPRGTSFMDEEACKVLPRILDAIGFRRADDIERLYDDLEALFAFVRDRFVGATLMEFAAHATTGVD